MAFPRHMLPPFRSSVFHTRYAVRPDVLKGTRLIRCIAVDVLFFVFTLVCDHGLGVGGKQLYLVYSRKTRTSTDGEHTYWSGIVPQVDAKLPT